MQFLSSFAILLQAKSNGSLIQMGMLGLVFVVFYFFMIRPQQAKQKEAKKFIEALKKGDDVVTIGGMHGKIVSLDDLQVVLEVDRGYKATFDRSAISQEASKKKQTALAKAE